MQCLISLSMSTKYRNDGHTVGVCVPVPYSVCRWSGDIGDCGWLRAIRHHLHGYRSCVWWGSAQLHVELVPRGMHNGRYKVRNKCTWWEMCDWLIGFWLSGCRCHQMLVNYSKMPWDEWQQQNRNINQVLWDVADTKLLINSEGCGYPPRVNCTEFAKRYGWVTMKNDGDLHMFYVAFSIRSL